MLLSEADLTGALDCSLRDRVSAHLSSLSSVLPLFSFKPFLFVIFLKIKRWEFRADSFVCFDEAISWFYVDRIGCSDSHSLFFG